MKNIVVYTYPEFKELRKKIEAGLPLLIELSIEIESKLKGFEYSIEDLTNVPLLVNEYHKSILPDNINGLPTNKEVLINQIDLSHYSHLFAISEVFNTYCVVNGIDAIKVYLKANNNVLINEDYLSELKNTYSIIARNPYDKILIAGYLQILDSINKFNKLANKHSYDKITTVTQLHRLFDFNEFELSPKPSILTDIVQSQKNK